MIDKKQLREEFYKFLESDELKNEDIFAFFMEEFDKLSGNFCKHFMEKTGKYERQCKFCGLSELTAD